MLKTKLTLIDVLVCVASNLTATYFALRFTSFDFVRFEQFNSAWILIPINTLGSLFFLRAYKPDYQKFQLSFYDYLIGKFASVTLTWLVANTMLAIYLNNLYGRIFTIEAIIAEIALSTLCYKLLFISKYNPIGVTLYCSDKEDIEKLRMMHEFERYRIVELSGPTLGRMSRSHLLIVRNLSLEQNSSENNFPLSNKILYPDLLESVQEKVEFKDDTNKLFSRLYSTIHKPYAQFWKRLTDIFFALLGLVLSVPLLGIAFILQKIFDPGPFLYSQMRTGLNSGSFKIYKIRTMRVDAESAGAVWTKVNDVRITRLGKILRKLRLDEIPQFYNVLQGDMSLIGPRPERPEFDDVLEKKIPNYRLRYLVRPGLSGHAQITYRYGASVEDSMEKLRYDLFYIKNLNFLFDLKLILNTLTYFFKSSR